MSSITILFLCIFTWLGIYLVIGFVGARSQKILTLEQYLVGGRKEKVLVMAAVLVAGQLSGWGMVGIPGLSYSMGMATFQLATFYGVFFMVGSLLVWMPASILGRKYGYVSCADLFADRYESKALGLVWAAIWLIFSVPYMVGQIMAAGALMEGFSGGVLPYSAGIAILAAVVVLYVLFGGMRSFVWVTCVQCVLLLLVLFGIQIYMNQVTPGGLRGAISWAQANRPEILGPPGPLGYWTIPMLLSWGVFLGFSSTTFAHLYPRMYAIKNSRTLVNMLVVYFLLLVFILLHYGITGPMGNVLIPSLENVDNFIPAFLGRFATPILGGFGAAGILAAILSTTAAILLSMAGIVTKEIYQTWIKPDADQRELLRVTRWGIAIWGGVSMMLAWLRPGLISFTVAMSMGGTLMLFVPMVAAFWWKRGNKYGAIAGPVAGEVVLVYLYATGGSQVSWGHVHPTLWSFLVSVVVFFAVCGLTPPSSQEVQERFHGYLNTQLPH
jgi:Na+/proline symporter